MASALGVTAALFSMHGLGGGVLFTPIQVMFGLDVHQAAVRTQWYILVTSLSSSLVFRTAGKIDWAAAFALEAAAVAGAYLGGSLAHHFSEDALLMLLGGLVLAAAWSMSAVADSDPSQPRRVFAPWRRSLNGCRYTIDLATALPLSASIGWLSGLAGVGGGFLKIPMLVKLYGMPLDVACGTSAFMVSLTTAGGMAGQLQAADPEWAATVAASLFVLAGAQWGPRFSLKAPREVLRRRFAGFLLLVAMLLLSSPLWRP